MQNYLSVYKPSERKNSWLKFETNSELGPCPTLCPPNSVFSKSGENVYECYSGEWSLAGNMVPQQYLDPRKDGLTEDEYDILDLPQDALVGDRAAGLLEDCFSKEKFTLFVCDSEAANDDYDMAHNCSNYEYYDYCEPRNYYRYRENGLWTLETVEDRYYDDHFKQPQCTDEKKDSVFVIPPEPGKPGKVYKCIWTPNVRNRFPALNYVSGYIFHKAEKVNLF